MREASTGRTATDTESCAFFINSPANEGTTAALINTVDSIERKEAAKSFAAEIHKLAEEGKIEELSIEIRDLDTNELLKLAKKAGIKKICVSAQYGS